MVRRTRPQMRNRASGNLEIPGLVLTHHPGMTIDGLHHGANIGQMRANPPAATTRHKDPQQDGSDLTMADGIFAGLKVLDCASFIAAPAAATVLSDFGAEVIKIEPPGS